jgi:hypothetical protein
MTMDVISYISVNNNIQVQSFYNGRSQSLYYMHLNSALLQFLNVRLTFTRPWYRSTRLHGWVTHSTCPYLRHVCFLFISLYIWIIFKAYWFGHFMSNQHRKVQNSTWPLQILIKFGEIQSFIEVSYNPEFYTCTYNSFLFISEFLKKNTIL